MANENKKRYTDYWKKFSGESTKRMNFNFLRSGSDSSSVLSFKFNFDKWIVFSILLFMTIGILLYTNYTTGNYVKILESNNTELESKLNDCIHENLNLTNMVNGLNSSLNMCNEDLDNKIHILNTCQNEKNECQSEKISLDASLSNCKDDVDECKSEYAILRSDYDDCKDDLNDCKDENKSCDNDYNNMKINYAKDYCCLLNQTQGGITSYRVESNRIICTNSTSDVQLSC